MYSIRKYNESSDFVMLHRWNAVYGALGPSKPMIPIESSFVLEMDNEPAAFLSVILTNVNFCYMENFVGNPKFKYKRLEELKALINHAAQFAKERGHDRCIAMTSHPKLAARYQLYGFEPTINVSAFLWRTK